jgi:hypothetical protein
VKQLTTAKRGRLPSDGLCWRCTILPRSCRTLNGFGGCWFQQGQRVYSPAEDTTVELYIHYSDQAVWSWENANYSP